jgi:tetratricopeptide (TPR) repeat protein
MKTFIQFLFLLTLVSNSLNGQENSNPSFEKAKLKNENVDKFFAENTNFPMSVSTNNVQEQVILSFIINKSGEIDSVKLISNPNKLFAIEALSALDKSTGLWIPTKSNGQSVDKKYKAVFNFTTTKSFFDFKNKALKLQAKGDNEKALQAVDKALKIDGYDRELYQSRCMIYKNLNKTELANSDIEKLKELDDTLLADIWLTIIGIPRGNNSF